MKRRSAVVLTASVVAIAAAAILLYIASIGGFDPSRRVISDPIEGRETQPVENPATPEHPAFPSPNTNNLSSSAVVDENISFAANTLANALGIAVAFLHF